MGVKSLGELEEVAEEWLAYLHEGQLHSGLDVLKWRGY